MKLFVLHIEKWRNKIVSNRVAHIFKNVRAQIRLKYSIIFVKLVVFILLIGESLFPVVYQSRIV